MRVWGLLSVAAFGVVAAVLGRHVWQILAIPGVADNTYCGLLDFRDQGYYPALSLLHGGNPYDAPGYLRQYPAVKVFAPYSPLILLMFLPFGMLPLWLAQILYYLVNLGLVLVLARFTLRACGAEAPAAAVFAM